MFKESKSDIAQKMLACAQASAAAYGNAYEDHVRRIRSLAEGSLFREPLSLEHSMLLPVPGNRQPADRPDAELLNAPMAFHLLARNFELLEDFGHDNLEILKSSPVDERGNPVLFYIYRGFNLRNNISSHWFDHYSQIDPGCEALRRPNHDGLRFHDLAIRERNLHFIRFMLDAPHIFRFDLAEPDLDGRNILHHMADAPDLSYDDRFLFAILAKLPAFEKLASAADNRMDTPAKIAAGRSNSAFLQLIGPFLKNAPAPAAANAGGMPKAAQDSPSPTLAQTSLSPAANPSVASEAFCSLISEQALRSLRSMLGFCPTPEQTERLGTLAREGRKDELSHELSKLSPMPGSQSAGPAPAQNYSQAFLLPLEQAVKALNSLGLLASSKTAPLHKRPAGF